MVLLKILEIAWESSSLYYCFSLLLLHLFTLEQYFFTFTDSREDRPKQFSEIAGRDRWLNFNQLRRTARRITFDCFCSLLRIRQRTDGNQVLFRTMMNIHLKIRIPIRIPTKWLERTRGALSRNRFMIDTLMSILFIFDSAEFRNVICPHAVFEALKQTFVSLFKASTKKTSAKF